MKKIVSFFSVNGVTVNLVKSQQGLSVEEDKKFDTLKPPESIDFINKKDPQEGQFVNGGNDVVNLEPYLEKLKVQLAEQPSQKVIFMLKFLQKRKIAKRYYKPRPFCI